MLEQIPIWLWLLVPVIALFIFIAYTPKDSVSKFSFDDLLGNIGLWIFYIVVGAIVLIPIAAGLGLLVESNSDVEVFSKVFPPEPEAKSPDGCYLVKDLKKDGHVWSGKIKCVTVYQYDDAFSLYPQTFGGVVEIVNKKETEGLIAMRHIRGRPSYTFFPISEEFGHVGKKYITVKFRLK